MRRKPQPPSPDNRQPWQTAQAARCGCRGTDDLCACQNEEAPWKYGFGGSPPPTLGQRLETRIRELEGQVRTLELQQQTDRQTIAALLARSAPNWADHEDDIDDAISDSIDMDWTSRDGARAVIRYLTSLAAPAERDAAGLELTAKASPEGDEGAGAPQSPPTVKGTG
jgi:hypothetical protein